MKDIFKKYKKANIIKNTWIVVASLVIALSINFFVFDSNLWNKIKADVLWVQNETWKSDIYLELNNNLINLKTDKNIKSLKSLTISIVYNPENVKIEDVNSDISWVSIKDISEEDWLDMIMLSLKNPTDINQNSNILSIKTSKKEEKTEWINIINANFTDESGEIYELSTSWIKF